MKKIVLILLLVSTGLLAQNQRNERIRALRTAFFTEALNLSSNEAEKFWPIYNAYDVKMTEIRKKERDEIFKVIQSGGVDNMSDAEANKLIDKSVAFKTEEFAHGKALIQDLRKVISPNKIIKLKKAEEDFKRRLLQQFRDRRQNKKN